MTLLPIIWREMLVASRQKKTYRVRFWSSVNAVIMGGGLIVSLDLLPRIPAGIGWTVFAGMAVFICFQCVGLATNTTDCISEEKREGTLGLLFLTDLSGWDVALGKLCANSLKSFYAVMGTFPVVAVVLTLGGVSLGQFCKVALAVLNVFFFAHATGLLASVLSRSLSVAHSLTGALLLGILGGPWLLAQWFDYLRLAPWTGGVVALSPSYALIQILDPRLGHSYWTSLLVEHLLTWLLLAMVSARLPECWKEKAGPRRVRWRERFRQWTYGTSSARDRYRREALGENPIWWLGSRNRLVPILLPCSAALMTGLWIWMLASAEWDALLPLFSATVVLSHLLVLGGVALEACRLLQEQRRSGALEFILSTTPLTVDDIFSGVWLLIRRRFFKIALAVLGSNLVLVWLSGTHWVKPDPDRIHFVVFVFAAIVMLGVDIIAAGWVGMWRAMAQNLNQKTSSPGAAAIETVALLVFVPLLGISMMGMAFDLIPWDGGKQLFEDFGFSFGLGFAFFLASALGFGLLARKKLSADFRQMAVVDMGEPIGILGQIGRLLGRVFRQR